MKTSFSILAIAAASIAAPAFADPAPIPPAPKPAAQEAGAPSIAPRFCIKEALTGSRIERKMCRTREEWSKQGVDVDARR